jgi:hypothetical protein
MEEEMREERIIFKEERRRERKKREEDKTGGQNGKNSFRTFSLPYRNYNTPDKPSLHSTVPELPTGTSHLSLLLGWLGTIPWIIVCIIS